MEKGFYCRFSVACGEIHEKGHGSAVEIARRKWVRQISERDEGMLNMMMMMMMMKNNTKHGEFHSRNRGLNDRSQSCVMKNEFFVEGRFEEVIVRMQKKKMGKWVFESFEENERIK